MVITVLLTGFKGTSTPVSINENATISELYKKIEEITSTESEYLILSFEGKTISLTQDGSKTLSSYGIKDKKSIQLLARQRGGMPLREKVPRTKDPDIILYDDDPTTWRYRMPCGHVMSKDGMKEYCNDEVKNLQYEIKCPDPKCKMVWETDLVRYVSGMTIQEEYDFEAKIGENYQKRGRPFKNCPQCLTACERMNKTNPRVVCSICRGFEFCWHCNGTWKTSNTTSCGNPECTGEDPLLTKLRKCPQTELLGRSGKFPKIRACPECCTIIEHIGGCKQMDCSYCKTKFCFVCLKKADSNGYQCGSYNSQCDIAPLQEYLFQ